MHEAKSRVAVFRDCDRASDAGQSPDGTPVSVPVRNPSPCARPLADARGRASAAAENTTAAIGTGSGTTCTFAASPWLHLAAMMKPLTCFDPLNAMFLAPETSVAAATNEIAATGVYISRVELVARGWPRPRMVTIVGFRATADPRPPPMRRLAPVLAS